MEATGENRVVTNPETGALSAIAGDEKAKGLMEMDT
jgi:hypothetical protein